MKITRVGSPTDPATKLELITEKDAAEYQRTKDELVKVLERLGGYEPAADDIYIDQIARIAIYAKKVEIFLDSGTANVETYSRVTDTKLKFSKIIDSAMRQLALTRRDRLGKESEASLMKELREAMLRGLNPAEQ
jgi:copper chaperone CopZ